ncbi:hypothetical protein DERP_003092 [Dermatophagoides pteronyssinus]|uniref:Uncharacterized protein n=1 Tax=Dermatophagoides pteronyssinus TaxID=6956 RepID=A0ABQ8JIH9_DERPT|nr:hypothetical protein DERP_003092 [Dermatophagoides pteronyssinus]
MSINLCQIFITIKQNKKNDNNESRLKHVHDTMITVKTEQQQQQQQQQAKNNSENGLFTKEKTLQKTLTELSTF